MNPLPAELASHLRDILPGRPWVQVIPRDKNEKRCAAYTADHYEIACYYNNMGTNLGTLALELIDQPEVYRTIVLVPPITIPADWPVRYNSATTFRAQVRALWRLPV